MDWKKSRISALSLVALAGVSLLTLAEGGSYLSRLAMSAGWLLCASAIGFCASSLPPRHIAAGIALGLIMWSALAALAALGEL